MSLGRVLPCGATWALGYGIPVAGKMNSRNASFRFPYLYLDSIFVPVIVSPNGAVGVSPTGSERGRRCRQCSGFPIAARLQDIPARVQEIALHSVRHGAVVALTAAQV